jgi:hypothetical protein
MTAFIASTVLALWIIQNNTALQDSVGKQIIQFIESNWQARITCSKPRINFFTCSLYLEQGTITPTDDKKFSWSFDACSVYISPFALLTKQEAHLYITLNNIKASTRATAVDEADLIEHIKTIFKPSDIDIAIEPKAVTINNIDLSIDYKGKPICCQTPGTFYIANDNDFMRFKDNTWHGSMKFDHALLSVLGVPYAHNAKGEVKFDHDQKTDTWLFYSTAQTKIPLFDPAITYVIDGSWNADGGAFKIFDGKEATRFACTFSYPLTIGIKGTFPANHIKTAVTLIGSKTENKSPVAGTCQADIVLLPDQHQMRSSGSLMVHNLTLGNYIIPETCFTLLPGPQEAEEALKQNLPTDGDMVGWLAWSWQNDLGSLVLTNSKIITLQKKEASGGYFINPQACDVMFTCNSDGLCKGWYEASITNQRSKKDIVHKGILAFKNKKIALKGSDNHGSYQIKAAFDPHLHLKRLRYEDSNGTPLLVSSTSKKSPFLLSGKVHWPFIRKFLDQQIRRLVFSNNSIFSFGINQENTDALIADIALKTGSFYMPEYHNLLRKCSARVTIQPEKKRAEIDNCSLGLSKGTITCPHAIVQLDQDNNLQHLVAPLCIDNVFVNWKKDFYGFVCGTLALNKTEHDAAQVTGTLVLKKSILKDAFLRGESADQLKSPGIGFAEELPFPLGIDLRLVTEKPIKAKTGSFDAQANVDLRIISPAKKDFFTAPTISGSINLEKGSLHILNQSLDIQYGKIQFMHHNMSDPLVDLIARNRIGKYLVTLQANGSLQKPSILLESTPSLSEEQIIGLLLTGSEQSTLQADLPAMLLQNLDALVFSTKKDGKGQVFMDTLTKTFKYVQITPNLDPNKPGGRGALKGSLSVNLTDQLRAKIDKDFDPQNPNSNLSDFSGQIEYLLSDNLNLKYVQKQRFGEGGIELEFQMKI